jgi:heme/copper-type cytochrome/quinol oxidase subunit 2
MAQAIAIRGSNYSGKDRNPLGVIGLSLITLGIYGIFHYYYVNKELAELGKARGTTELGENPMMSVLAIVPGAILIVPAFVSVWNTWQRQSKARQMFGVQAGIDPVPGFLLHVFIGVVGVWFLQAGQNGVLEAQARA